MGGATSSSECEAEFRRPSVSCSQALNKCAMASGPSLRRYGNCDAFWPSRLVMESGGFQAFDADVHEQCLPIERRYLDFFAQGAVPEGWIITAEDVPGAFSVLGRHSAVIQRIGDFGDPSPGSRSVLLGIPRWSVDKSRTEWLLKTSGLVKPGSFAQLEYHSDLRSSNTVVCGFRYPVGVPLHVWRIRFGEVSEAAARGLCRDLLQMNVDLQGALRFWGLLLPSAVFVTEAAQPVLSSVIPFGCILSWKGTVATCSDIHPDRLAPEVVDAFDKGYRRLDIDKNASGKADVYAIAALALEAMAGVPPWQLRDESVQAMLSDMAMDFFAKATFKDPEWRLSMEDALQHPWLSVIPGTPKVRSMF
eukprot:TRINITY_DN8562_c0_g1_i1.p1 TRINITY_DN8562_c0_g1~~TRINITY_DN8562_c0_g1_i1.p1  ORF type:complete len:362 (-),score=71.96 TRINITY_DN8562_c0_g1_i1:318-1403(-)